MSGSSASIRWSPPFTRTRNCVMSLSRVGRLSSLDRDRAAAQSAGADDPGGSLECLTVSPVTQFSLSRGAQEGPGGDCAARNPPPRPSPALRERENCRPGKFVRLSGLTIAVGDDRLTESFGQKIRFCMMIVRLTIDRICNVSRSFDWGRSSRSCGTEGRSVTPGKIGQRNGRATQFTGQSARIAIVLASLGLLGVHCVDRRADATNHESGPAGFANSTDPAAGPTIGRTRDGGSAALGAGWRNANSTGAGDRGRG